jgi:hypothetical protein
MHAVIRTYTGIGARDLFDLLEKRKSEVEGIMRSVDGFESYLLVRTAEGGSSVTVCEDKAGTDESVRRAREWIATNASDIPGDGPRVSEGPVILYSKLDRERVGSQAPMEAPSPA